ncbi:MAG: uroporphyrinogen-III synthase [Thermoleophilia bacterium]|nr:uroporphyrinogen-III synthase [Thermoleophilia bacterium]
MARIWVTRPHERARELVERLQGLGHEVVVEPLIAVEPTGPDAVEVDRYDWVVVTSRTGARELARRRRGVPRRLAAIGPGTAAELRAHGLEPDLVPRTSTQEGLLVELPHPAGRVLFAGAERARRLLVERLGADFVPLYRTRELRPAGALTADLAVLASPSAARAYAALGGRAPAVVIGPETARAARAGHIQIVAEAQTHDLDGLVRAVILALR